MAATLIDPKDAWYGSHAAINALAWWYLKDSRELVASDDEGRIKGGRQLLIWNDAMGFGDEREPTTLTVFEEFQSLDDKGAGKVVVREAVWQRSKDLDELFAVAKKARKRVSFEPTINIRDATVDYDFFSEFLRESSSFHVPAVWFQGDAAISSDVGSQGFEYFGKGGPEAVLRLEWSCEIPPEWERIIEWCGRLEKYLIECLDSSHRALP